MGSGERAGEKFDTDAPVLVERRGHLGRLTLNRPVTLNALTIPMVRAMQAALLAWRDKPEVANVLIDGDGRAFCAGGDIRAVYNSAISGSSEAVDLWREQYVLNALILGYPKPVVTFLDGITMGGGVGIGCHAEYRIATEHTLLAMPEVSIGLAPDVGGLHLLAGAPGEVGTHLALTAGRIRAEDALWCGLADHYVAADKLDKLRELLTRLPAGEAIDSVSTRAGLLAPPPLEAARIWIDACYGGDDLQKIVDRLRAAEQSDARAAAEIIDAMSPLATVVCLRALRSAAVLNDVQAVFVQDYRVTVRFLDTPDLASGIRSAAITKDRSPVWNPVERSAISPAMVERHFAPLGVHDLLFGDDADSRA